MHRVNIERHANSRDPQKRPPGVFTLHDSASEFNLARWRTKLSSLTDIIALSGAKSFIVTRRLSDSLAQWLKPP